MAYQPTKPAPNDNLDVSVTDIQQNFLTANTVMGIDHYPFDDVSANKGYHKYIHQISQADPGAILGVNQGYVKSYTPDTTVGVADTQLFSMTGLGVISQLTGKLIGTDGWMWCSGLLVQWGSVTFASSTSHLVGKVTFKDRVPGAIPFTSCYVVIPQLEIASSSTTTASNTLAIRQITATTFTWVYNSSSSSGSGDFPGFYWVAIGV